MTVLTQKNREIKIKFICVVCGGVFELTPAELKKKQLSICDKCAEGKNE